MRVEFQANALVWEFAMFGHGIRRCDFYECHQKGAMIEFDVLGDY